MKSEKPLWIVILVLLLFIFWNSCDDQVKTNLKNTEQSSLKKPTQMISYEYAKLLEQEYIKTRWNVLNDTLNLKNSNGYPTVDTREFLFSLDSLKQYIAYVEFNAKKMGYSNLGIRVYNAAYPKGVESPDPGFSTVFLVPTGDKIKTQKAGAIMSFNTVLFNEQIQQLQPLNYAHGGKPPKDL